MRACGCATAMHTLSSGSTAGSATAGEESDYWIIGWTGVACMAEVAVAGGDVGTGKRKRGRQDGSVVDLKASFCALEVEQLALAVPCCGVTRGLAYLE